MKWLLRRELWENKGGFVWAPAVVGVIMVLIAALSAIVGVAMGEKHGIHLNGNEVMSLGEAVDAETKARILEALANGYVGFAAPLFLIMTFAIFFFCLGSLFDDRKDKSVLFWKSLPVSDAQTVLSKAAMALVGAPLLTLGIGFATSVVFLVVICLVAAFGGLNLFGVLAEPGLYLSPLEMAAMLPVYAAWALPTVGWLMMVSAWARTKPFLWAVGVPVVAGALLSWFEAIFDYGIRIELFWQHVVGRGLGSVVPGIWFAFTDVGHNIGNGNDHADFTDLLAASWQVFGTANLWIGAVLGAAMIFAAIKLRRWRDEG
jgi:ABC-2 type transport system permease protein